MQLRHAVDGVGEVDVQVRHADVALRVDDLHEGVVVFGAHPGVQPVDDGHQPGHDLLQIGPRPLLQRLGQDGVIGVGAHVAHDGDGLVLSDAAFLEQTDQLRDDQRGMGVVDLDGGVVGEVVQVASSREALFQDQPRGIGHHEVLLVHAQQAPLLGAVVGVQEEREAAGDIPCVEADAGLDQSLVRGIHVEEAQPAALALVAGDVDLIQGGTGGEIAEGDVIMDVRAAHPALLAPFEPAVRGLGLLAAHEALAE